LCHTNTAAISKVNLFRMLQNSAKNIGLVMTHCTYEAKSMCTPRVRKKHPDGHSGIPLRRFRNAAVGPVSQGGHRQQAAGGGLEQDYLCRLMGLKPKPV